MGAPVGRLVLRGARWPGEVAVEDGRIVAVGQSFHLNPGDPERFSIMLPDSAFREGSNRIQLLAVTGDTDPQDLSLIAQAG
jgi:hypothetical protein